MTAYPRISLNTDGDLSRCFGCGQANPIGLKLSFQWDGKTARAGFTPTEFYQGWPGLVHGGIIICLLDEAMSYAVIFEGMNGVTANIEVKLRQPVAINKPLIITAVVTRKTRKLVKTRAAVSLADGTLIAEGTGTHFVADAPRREAKPGSSAPAWHRGDCPG